MATPTDDVQESAMWNPLGWAATSHEQAVANARSASTECARRRVEREDVGLFLDSLSARDGRHNPGAVAEHPA